MKLRRAFFAVILFASSHLWAGQAQPVPIPEDQSILPQIQIDGVGIGTASSSRNAERQEGGEGINFSDSAVQLGAAQRLYDGGAVGSLGFGGLTLDESNRGTGTSFFLHQAFLDYQSESFEALIGRSDNPIAHVVDFPTLRGDDLVTLTNPLDPYSSGANPEEHRYSNVASVTFNQSLKYFESIHVQHLIDSAGIGTETKLNSFGATFEYMGTVGMEAFERVPAFGVGYEHVTLNANSPGGLHQIYGGGVINLNESVTDRLDLRVQDILSLGSDLDSLSSATDSFQANSNAVAASIRFLHSPFGRPGYQLALTGGFKSYLKISDARSSGWALTGVKRLGQGFDLVAQYQGQWRSTPLARAQSYAISYEQVGELGFIFSFGSTFNQHISPRRTMLNQQHQYIPN